MRKFGREAVQDIKYYEYEMDSFDYTRYEDLESRALESSGVTMMYNSELETSPFGERKILMMNIRNGYKPADGK